MFDKKKAGEIFGSPEVKGAKYIQDGVYYDAKGEPIVKPAIVQKTVEPPQKAVETSQKDEYSDMHHLSIKRLVERQGGKYTDRESAIKWLKANDVS